MRVDKVVGNSNLETDDVFHFYQHDIRSGTAIGIGERQGVTNGFQRLYDGIGTIQATQISRVFPGILYGVKPDGRDMQGQDFAQCDGCIRRQIDQQLRRLKHRNRECIHTAKNILDDLVALGRYKYDVVNSRQRYDLENKES